MIRTDKARRIRSAMEHKHAAATSAGGSGNWHKDNLAACFDSSHAIAPLWEDRYLDASGKVRTTGARPHAVVHARTHRNGGYRNS